MHLTILHLRILLHYAYCGAPWNFLTTLHTQYADDLVKLGLLSSRLVRFEEVGHETEYTITDKGLAHVKALQDAPLPFPVWVSFGGFSIHKPKAESSAPQEQKEATHGR